MLRLWAGTKTRDIPREGKSYTHLVRTQKGGHLHRLRWVIHSWKSIWGEWIHYLTYGKFLRDGLIVSWLIGLFGLILKGEDNSISLKFYVWTAYNVMSPPRARSRTQIPFFWARGSNFPFLDGLEQSRDAATFAQCVLNIKKGTLCCFTR